MFSTRFLHFIFSSTFSRPANEKQQQQQQYYSNGHPMQRILFVCMQFFSSNCFRKHAKFSRDKWSRLLLNCGQLIRFSISIKIRINCIKGGMALSIFLISRGRQYRAIVTSSDKIRYMLIFLTQQFAVLKL